MSFFNENSFYEFRKKVTSTSTNEVNRSYSKEIPNLNTQASTNSLQSNKNLIITFKNIFLYRTRIEYKFNGR